MDSLPEKGVIRVTTFEDIEKISLILEFYERSRRYVPSSTDFNNYVFLYWNREYIQIYQNNRLNFDVFVRSYYQIVELKDLLTL